MHTIDLLEEALQIAAKSGFEIRREWLSGATGGACRIGSQRVLFIDLSLTAAEQLEQVIDPLRTSAVKIDEPMSSPLRRLLSDGQT